VVPSSRRRGYRGRRPAARPRGRRAPGPRARVVATVVGPAGATPLH
jgi:hypothetical protein